MFSPARPEPLPPAGGRTDLLATSLLSWVAGFVDTAGFIGLDRLFPAHVTGNLVVAAAALAGAGGERAWVRLGVIPVFMAAVGLATVLLRRDIRLWALVVLEASLLLAHALLCRLLLGGVRDVSVTAMAIAGSAAVAAMGLQTALMRERFGHLAPTTVMTGNLTQLTRDGTWLMLHYTASPPSRPGAAESEASERGAVQRRLGNFGLALVGFLLGAGTAAAMAGDLNAGPLFLPVGALAALAWHLHRREKTVLRR